MIRSLVYSGRSQETAVLLETMRRQAALLTEDRWEIHSFYEREQLEGFLVSSKELDLICFDVMWEQGIFMIEQFRKKNRQAYIVVIASDGISPLVYLKPSIMAAALLLRPFNQKDCEKVIREIVAAMDLESRDDGRVFLLDSPDGRIRVPFYKINYFESREKKIFLCTAEEEYGFYDSLERLSSQLPEYFVRCHRGYIVNTKEIQKYVLKENLIYLKNGWIVPVSRSYREKMKEYR